MPLRLQNLDEQNRATKRSMNVLVDDRAVKPPRKDKLLADFEIWLMQHARTTLAALIEAPYANSEQVSDLLVAYGKDLYNAGKAYGRYAETINAVSARWTVLQRQLVGAWDLVFVRVAEELHTHHPAMPLPVVLAFAALSLLWGWPTESALLLMTWSGLLRIGEALAATRPDFVLPGDGAPGGQFSLLQIEQPNSRGVAAKHQAARIGPSDVVRLPIAVFGKLNWNDRFWHYSPNALRRRFSQLQGALGLTRKTSGCTPFDLASLRPAGAAHLLHQFEDAELVRAASALDVKRSDEALINSFTTVQTALSGVDVALSSAYHKSHQEMVHDEIRRTIGFTKLNEMVQLRMNQWLIGAATKELQIMKQTANEKNKKEQIGLQELADNLGRMLRESGNFEGAEFYFKDLLEEIERMYGKDHALALSCLNQLAVTLQKANHVEEALQCHRDCLQRRRRVLGENHEETLQSVSNLAVLLSLHRPMSIEIFEEARSLYSLAVKGRELTIGEKDPRTLYTLSNFARFLSEAPEPSAELFKESDQLHERAVQSLKDLLQQGHPLTLSSLHNQACSWLDRCVFQKTCSAGGPIDESISQLRLVHKLRVEKLGKEHPDTQQTERKLQEIARIQKQFANADANGADQGRLESFPSFQDFFQAHFEVVHTAEEFQQVRKFMHEGIVADLVFDDLLASGFIDEDGFMTTGMQPYIFLAHIIVGELCQRKCEPEQDYLGTYGDTFVVAHNKPESDEMWPVAVELRNAECCMQR
eukprot:s127_g43.t3